MTAKRDFKRRVRQRQVRTGESYVTARRHLMASRPGAGEPPGEGAAKGDDTDGDDDHGHDEGEDGGDGEDGGAEDGASVVGDDTEPTDPGLTAGGPTAAEPTDPGLTAAGPTAAEPTDPGPAAVRSVGAGPRNLTVLADLLSGAATARASSAGQAGPVSGPISVVELVDVSEQARRVGVMCRALMFPTLAARVEPARVLSALREVLLATVGDPEADTALLAGLVLAGQVPPPRRPEPFLIDGLRRFLKRARGGLGGAFHGEALAFHVAHAEGLIPVLCALAARDTAIELSIIEDAMPERWGALERQLERRARALNSPVAIAETMLSAWLPTEARLYLVHAGLRHVVSPDGFVIGRNATADFMIKDGNVSRRHALVLRERGAYYLKDLGSAHGIYYKGMRIDNKRIDEGDVFDIAGHEIGFTYRGE